jgi:hypothetical protein
MTAADLQLLADRILPFARDAIAEEGFLVPVAACVSPRGEVVPLRRSQPVDGEVDVPELVDELLRALRTLAQRGDARAVAWCIDMRVVPPGTTEKTDAIVLFFESAAGASVVVTPYRDAPGPGTAFAKPYGYRAQPQVFTAER